MASNFAQRKKDGKEATKRLVTRLEDSGLVIAATGQERLLNSLHHLIRFQYDRTSSFAKHFPDLFCVIHQSEPFSFYAEVKSTSKEHWDGPNFSVETASLAVCQFLDRRGIHTALFFENRPNEFYAAWAQNVKSFKHLGLDETQSCQGSRTPMSLVRKDTLLSIEEFLTALSRIEKL